MPFILGTNSIKDTSYSVDNSLRFNSASADSLTRAASGNGTSNQKFTMSLWVKKSSNDSAARRLIELYNTSSYYVSLRFRDDQSNRLDFYSESDGAGVNLRTNRSFRDTSAWYHIVLAVDTTDSTANDRMKMYVNGVQETSFASRTNFGSNENINFNNSGDNQLISISEGASNTENDRKFNGYMAEICFIDGLALAPTSFGEFDLDSPTIWKPIDVSGLTFGNNGFYLETKQAGTSQNSSGLGADTSGNDNHFAVNNLTAVDQSTDTCTNNFAIINSLDNFYAGSTFSEGNLQFVTTNGNYTFNTSTFGVSSGKWYAEVEFDAVSGGSGPAARIGVAGKVSGATSNGLGDNTGTAAYMSESGQVHFNGSDASYGDTYATGDVIGIALDVDNSKLYFSKNGVFQNSGDPTSGATGTGAISITAVSSTDIGFYFIAVGEFDSTYNYTFKINFGSPPYSISSSNADANGHGNFEYAVPSGYFALCSKNLAEHG